MKIGTVRVEEAVVADSHAGYHQFHAEEGESGGSFEIFWHDPASVEAAEDQAAGWYWWACFPGCYPDGDFSGPFASSTLALYDADEFHPDNQED